ncbi:uncharacterized protein NEMAJ01_0443 [Nematocida major]|uniref:uncharacterized protein n=1 Tax=Nematocida major TaxID=1912982 RepID=UPI002008292F|nr:uncharacterized protein NEMAJ01_0443 [Nematocida major]KAH9385547.1 hypothetical protein NEMAJ01_0443 [Nematocida major]
MIHSEEQLDAKVSASEQMAVKIAQEISMQFAGLHTKLEGMLNEREEKEQKRMDRLLVTVSEQLNRNVAALFETIIQREVRGPLQQKIEKALGTKIDQKMGNIPNVCTSAIQSSIEGKALQNFIGRTLKSAIVEGIVPVIENGMNEIRLQVLDRIKTMPISMESVDDAASESKDETLDRIADALHEYNHIEEGPFDIITHLLETDIEECFAYVIESNDPEAFMFLLNKLPPDAEINLNNRMLMLFIQQIVSFVGSGWKTEPYRSKYTSLLENALSHIKKERLSGGDINTLRNTMLQLLTGCPDFGETKSEQFILDIMHTMGLY